LKLISRPDINVTTIEDPVEYKVPGINQIPVNEQTGLTFARGLRTIVRQDPDVILVGEIRDTETAEIAVNAALTGHMLFSTFHANDAATTIPRLLDMGVEPFLLSSTLDLIIAQRLVRKVCENCRISVSLKKEEITKLLGAHAKEVKGKTFYKGKGCPHCNFYGYKGRVGIFEVISMTRELKELVIKNPSRADVWALAKKQGATSLFEDGLEKVHQGVTTLAELVRVAPID
jgi:type IV pilus assembly protein PilB